MNVNDVYQVIFKRKKKRRFFEQSFHQVLFEKRKKHVKCIPNEKSTQSLRNVDEEYHVKKNEIAQRFHQIEKIFRYLYENEIYKID
jgi:hypothetical protein